MDNQHQHIKRYRDLSEGEIAFNVVDLRAKLAEVLAEGGARKPSILKALAKSLGFTGREYERVVRGMFQAGALRIVRRYGGAHYDLAGRR